MAFPPLLVFIFQTLLLTCASHEAALADETSLLQTSATHSSRQALENEAKEEPNPENMNLATLIKIPKDGDASAVMEPSAILQRPAGAPQDLGQLAQDPDLAQQQNIPRQAPGAATDLEEKKSNLEEHKIYRQPDKSEEDMAAEFEKSMDESLAPSEFDSLGDPAGVTTPGEDIEVPMLNGEVEEISEEPVDVGELPDAPETPVSEEPFQASEFPDAPEMSEKPEGQSAEENVADLQSVSTGDVPVPVLEAPPKLAHGFTQEFDEAADNAAQQNKQPRKQGPSQNFNMGSKPVPEFEINLDLPPEDRFNEISEHFIPAYMVTYNIFSNSSRAHRWAQNGAIARGPEDAELMAEITGISRSTKVPEYWLQTKMLSADFQSLRGPYAAYMQFMNLTMKSDEEVAMKAKAYPDKVFNAPEFMTQVLELPSFGCTGIIARDETDGTVWHARNLEFSFAQFAQNLTYNGRFMKGGKELFTGQMVYPYTFPTTGIRRGPNGYTYAFHARYFDYGLDKIKKFANTMLKDKLPPAGWSARKILENVDNYEEAVKNFSNRKISSLEYDVITGVKKGTVIARDPDGPAYTMDLGSKEFPRYIVMSNFDYTKGDLKEFIKVPRVPYLTRRVRAQQMLNKTKVITPAFLQQVMGDRDVMEGNTLFQSMMNVEHDVYSSTLPNCADCMCAYDECQHAVNFNSQSAERIEYILSQEQLKNLNFNSNDAQRAEYVIEVQKSGQTVNLMQEISEGVDKVVKMDPANINDY